MVRSSRTAAALGLSVLLALLTATEPLRPHPGNSADPSPARTARCAYLFLSPNTDENLDLDQALVRLSSPGHRRFRAVASVILRQLGLPDGRVVDALGDWGDGAENSLVVLLPPPADPATLRYAAVWFGLLAKQKSVLVFTPGPGPDALYELDVTGADLPGLRRTLDGHGIVVRTIVARPDCLRVLVFDEGRRLEGAVTHVARECASKMQRSEGTGQALGETTRGQARSRYQEEIRRYEGQPRRVRFQPAHLLAVGHP